MEGGRRCGWSGIRSGQGGMLALTGNRWQAGALRVSEIGVEGVRWNELGEEWHIA